MWSRHQTVDMYITVFCYYHFVFLPQTWITGGYSLPPIIAFRPFKQARHPWQIGPQKWSQNSFSVFSTLLIIFSSHLLLIIFIRKLIPTTIRKVDHRVVQDCQYSPDTIAIARQTATVLAPASIVFTVFIFPGIYWRAVDRWLYPHHLISPFSIRKLWTAFYYLTQGINQYFKTQF